MNIENIIKNEQTTLVQKECGFGRCVDCDDDCQFVKHKLDCFLFDPEQGYCPYLSGEIK